MEQAEGLLATCVDNIREGLRKINVCKDVDKEAILQPLPETISTEKRGHSNKKHVITNFDSYLDSLPVLDSNKRTIQWILNISSDYCIVNHSLTQDLPMRGTILPTRYTPGHDPILHYDDDEEELTSISSYESARGTHARGTPPQLPQGQPRMDAIFLKIQQSLERDARKELISKGEQHLLSYNLMDVYRHQVASYPLGTTPEIIPFMSLRNSQHLNYSTAVRGQTNHKHYHLPIDYNDDSMRHYNCLWSDCQAYFANAKDLVNHVEETHILTYTSNKICCQWNNCKKTFSIRYKLLLHIHNVHCYDVLARDKRAALTQKGPQRWLAPVIKPPNESQPNLSNLHHYVWNGRLRSKKSKYYTKN